MVVLNKKNIYKYGKDIEYLNELYKLITIKKHQLKHIEILECLDASILDEKQKYIIVDAYYKFYKHFTGRNSSVLSKYNYDIVNKSSHIEPLTKNKTKDLFNYDELNTILDTLTDSEYMLLYLILKIGVRNTDTLTFYNNTHSDIENYFIYEDDKLLFIRNRYKNYKKYGKLIIEITDERFKEYINKLPINTFIFKNRNGDMYDARTIALKLNRIITFNGSVLFSRRVLMGQAEIFKELETKYKDDVEYLNIIYKQRPNMDKIIKV